MSAAEAASNDGSDLSMKALRIIHVLDAHEGTANTAEVRKATDISGQLIRYHTDKLADRGLLEIVGTQEVGNGNPAKVYGLTESGESIVAEFTIGEGATPKEERDELRRRLDRLEAKVERLAEALAESEEAVEDLDGDLRDVVTQMSRLASDGGR